MIDYWFCWPRVKHVARHGIKHRHPIGHARRVVRHVVKHKIAWTCVAVIGSGAGMWGLAWPELAPGASASAPPPGPVAYLPPEAIAELPPGPLFLPPLIQPTPPSVEVAGPPVLLPELPIETPPSAPPEIAFPPQGPVQRVPEPGSLALLASGLAAFFAWRTRI